jgi:aminoglycoside phosphotransferase (APT) family kinase protein
MRVTIFDDPSAAARVRRWLDERPGVFASPLISVETASIGRSNVTLFLTDARGSRLVLRHPPLSSGLETAHDVLREARILKALAETAVLVPKIRAECDDPDVAPVPFYLMDCVDGLVLDNPVDAHALTRKEREALTREVPQTLARIHSLDPSEIGLDSLGRSRDYAKRQLFRWTSQWQWPEEDRTSWRFKMCHDQLVDRGITDAATARIVHGDYRIGNLIVLNGRIQSVLDWELAALGDPIADLAYLLNNWVEPADEDRGPIVSATLAGGFGSRGKVLAAYEEAMGHTVDRATLSFYRALSYWRTASIRSGVFLRLSQSADPLDRARADEFHRTVPLLIDAALKILNRNPEQIVS